jgi:hypothetical protein
MTIINWTALGLVGAVASLLLMSGCAAPDGSDGVSERSSEILAGTPTSDPAGYAFLQDEQSTCSSTLLTPEWVLTAGHCLEDNNGLLFFQNPFTAAFNLGTTTNRSTAIGNQGFINPQWFDPSQPAAQRFPKDVSNDVALVRLGTAFKSTGYPNGLYNELSNTPLSAGQTLTCYGYGATTTTQTAGTVGNLQKASLVVSNPAAQLSPFALAVDGEKQSSGMIALAGNAQGQQLYFGDSGGSCSVQGGSPYQIVGINDPIDTSTSPITSYLLPVQAIHGWVDQIMHSSTQSLGLPPAGTPKWTSAVSTPAQNGTTPTDAIYVISAYPGARSGQRLYMRAFNTPTGWSAWSVLGTTGLPSSGINSRVGLAATTESPGTVRLELVVLGADQKMYIAPLTPGFSPSSAWTSLTWSVIGAGVFKAGTQPSIIYNDPRIQVFGIGTDAKIWTNFKNDFPTNTWISDWNQVPTPMTFAQGISVTFSQGSYLVAGLSDDTAQNPNTGNSPWIVSLSGATGNSWGTWSTPTFLGGNFLSPPSITAWIGGLAMYGLGLDSNLWRLSHNLSDPMYVWGGWYNLLKGTFKQPEGVSANTSSQSATEIDIVTTDSASTPMLIRYPQ